MVEVAPGGTVTVAGIVIPAGDEVRFTTAPPVPAAAFNATVQVDTDPGLSAIGVQEKPLRAGAETMVTTPLLLAIGRVAAPAPAAVSLVSWICEDVSIVEVDTVRATVATMPSGIVASFNPDTMHCAVPAELAQVTDLFAPVATGPAAIEIAEKSAVG